MRHRVAHRKLGRVTEHRIAMLRNQAHGAAPARADRDDGAEGEGAAAVRRADHHASPSAASRGGAEQRHGRCTRAGWCCATSRTARSSASCSTRSRRASTARPGGYTRILRLGYRRGDSAEVAQIELVGSEYNPERRGGEGRGGGRSRSRRASAAGCARRPSGCAARRPRAPKARRRPPSREGPPSRGKGGSGKTDTRGKGRKTSRRGRPGARKTSSQEAEGRSEDPCLLRLWLLRLAPLAAELAPTPPPPPPAPAPPSPRR